MSRSRLAVALLLLSVGWSPFRSTDVLQRPLTLAMGISDTDKIAAFDEVAWYLDGLGYKPELVMIGRRGDTDILIVGRALRQFTTDFPTTLRISGLATGIYFVKGNALGPTTMIAQGREHEFPRGALWRPFR